MTMSTPSRLSELSVGQSANVLAVDVTTDSGVRAMEMGLIPGTEVKLVAVAPLGDPLVFELRGYRLSLRRAEASGVEVSPR
ncbi:FeoA family protein [Tautonia plasticadhaerens]|uniref:Ferrous iron transport protein A n=1 Tax=Tautonia plasticadhaerens TaxID=2527974 RepID=A0A518GV44_9BACT|nr:FeoA family protein [Tautonia plasticadhaerens]QDV32454.1 ferrous iron transport protein A [Tautonia plasticadhaerens]